MKLTSHWLLTIAFLLGVLAGKAQDAKEIVQKCDEHMRGASSVGEMKMTIIRPKWQRELTFKTWTLSSNYTMMLLESPARDKGTAFLRRDKEIWNWQPSIERIIKMPPSMMSQSWMGSDFTNDDLVKQSSIVNDYTHKIVGEETLENRPCYIIELIPKPDAAVVWGKVKLWISKADYLEMKAEYYDEDMQLVNTMLGKDVKKMGGRLLPSTLEVIPADEPGNKTVVQQLNIDFNANLSQDFFSIQHLKSLD